MPKTAAPPVNAAKPATKAEIFDYAAVSVKEILCKLSTAEGGLVDREAHRRLALYGTNEPAKHRRRGPLIQFLGKFANPLIVVLTLDGVLSWFIGEVAGAFLIMGMVILSVTIGFVQEYRSSLAAEELINLVRTTATVRRRGRLKEIPIKELVPGDVVELSAGDVIPADMRFIACKELHVNQSAMTGESMPVEKGCEASTRETATNLGFMGTSVVSGSARGVVFATGAATRFGEVAKELAAARPPTSFDRGITTFSLLMIKAMFVMVVVIFIVNTATKGHFIEALMFSLAVAVGLTPEMLPTIVAVNLAKGASVMAKRKVVVKHLNAIQNFGAMDILCTDKTGTLTLDQVVLMRHCDVHGHDDEEMLNLAYLNSSLETGLKNLLDRAVIKHGKKMNLKGWKKIDEIPFDFTRRVMSVVVESPEGRRLLISKGAPEAVIARSTGYELGGRRSPFDGRCLPVLQKEVEKLNSEGFRVLALATKDVTGDQEVFRAADETGLTLRGYLAFLDPPKPSAKQAIDRLEDLGIKVKILTGDNPTVSAKICADVGLNGLATLTGDAIDAMDDEALGQAAEKMDIFARLNPMQKERVIRVLQKGGHTVGYLGDGINDAASLHIADVGISVNNAVDIAKESAELILLEKDLTVLVDGVTEGRRTFGNIIKYVRMGSSSNFGNMVSMTGASLFLPFVPMAPVQVLLNNFLYDLSQIAIPTDKVDAEYLRRPRPWNVAGIRRFMLMIGSVSSLFDFITFAVAWWVFRAPPELFRTLWFMESLCTQTLVIFIIRTAKLPFLQSRPSRILVRSGLIIVGFGLILPYTPLAESLGFFPPPLTWFIVLCLIVAAYLLTTELIKRRYVRRFGLD